jgi:hypothetical protein
VNITKEEKTEPTRERLVKRADRVRARMVERVGELDDRRQELDNLVSWVTTRARQHIPLVVGAAVASLALVSVVAIRRAKQQRHQHRHQWRLRVEPPDSRGFLARALKDAGVAIAVQLAKRAAERLALDSGHPAADPSRRLAPGAAE